VESDHCFEHLPDPFAVMKEVHRIAKNGATVIIRVPHFSRGFTHAEHKAGFDVTFPYYFRKGFKGGYQGVEFETTAVRLRWFAQPYFKRTVLSPPVFWSARAMGAFFSFFANENLSLPYSHRGSPSMKSTRGLSLVTSINDSWTLFSLVVSPSSCVTS
jgi:hypothetical protein